MFTTKMLTLVFTDIVGSTQIKREIGDQKAAEIGERHDKIVRDLLSSFPDSRERVNPGDSFFCTFGLPSHALLFSLGLQAHIQREFPQGPVRVRIGLHLGEVQESPDGKLFGTPVDCAARVMDLAGAGQILSTRDIRNSTSHLLAGEATEGSALTRWENYGPYTLKGIKETFEIWEVGDPGIAPFTRPAAGAKGKPSEEDLSAERQRHFDLLKRSQGEFSSGCWSVLGWLCGQPSPVKAKNLAGIVRRFLVPYEAFTNFFIRLKVSGAIEKTPLGFEPKAMARKLVAEFHLPCETPPLEVPPLGAIESRCWEIWVQQND